jgi:hypothetical protein
MLESLIISSLIKKEVIAQTIGESTKSIFHNLSHIMEDEFKLKNIIEELDLTSKIDIINDLIKDVDKEDINNIIHKAIHYLHDIIETINKEVEDIKKEIKEHTELWFHRYRTPNYINKIGKLIKHNQILDKRLDLFIKVFNIEK